MEVRLVSLELESFGSFNKKVVIPFPQGDAVVAICGKWKGSEVTSGTGKTTIIKGIGWCLDIIDSPVDSLKHWYSTKKPYAKLTIQAGTDRVEIIRNPKLSLVINGEPWNSLVKGAKEQLQTILGKSPDMVKAITYRKQRVRGKIVNSTDSQLKEFLTQPLGLDEVEVAADVYVKLANSIQGQIDLLKRDIQNFEMTLPMNQVADLEILNANQTVAESCKNYEAANAKLNSLKDINNVTAALWKEVEATKAEINKIHALNTAIQGKRRDNASYKNSIVNLQKEIQRLEENTCFTCQRQWDTAGALKETKTAEMEKFINALEVNIEYIKNAEPVLTALPNWEAQLQVLNSKLGEAHAPLDMANTSLRNAEMSMYSAKTGLQNIENKRKNYETLLTKFEATKADIAAKELEQSINQGAASLLGRSGFLGSIFDEILTDIEVRTNDMLSHFPNASQFTVGISSTREIKSKGTTKKEISIGISRNGMELSLDDNASGGQQSGIELCSDLGAAEAIIARSGGSLKWICLDEVLDGLGAEEKRAVVAMIKERFKGLVFMIEHSTEIRESFDKIIEVEYDGRESHVISV